MRKRSISIPIRVTEKELTTIEIKATKAGMNRTDYLIACAVGKRTMVIDDLTPLLAELRRIGNNLNQLTRLAHLGKIEAISLAEANEVLQQTYEKLRQLARKGAKDWQR
ncbi:MAG: MobC family plasmid mobilization relaxosome protein [Clostridia bacterium]|nr:MobC family plasmid mobilization relaxosome protein [Clostridia bacterium]